MHGAEVHRAGREQFIATQVARLDEVRRGRADKERIEVRAEPLTVETLRRGGQADVVRLRELLRERGPRFTGDVVRFIPDEEIRRLKVRVSLRKTWHGTHLHRRTWRMRISSGDNPCVDIGAFDERRNALVN